VPLEDWDSLLPSPGFITDFVYATKWWATPSKFATWGALFAISTILKRDAWLKWADKRLYCNLFACVVADPAFFAKSTLTDAFVEGALMKVEGYLRDPMWRARKDLRIYHGGVTGEAMYKELATPIDIHWETEEGKEAKLKRPYSYGAVISSEMGVFLSDKKYAGVNLIQRLDDLYSSKDTDDVVTISRGRETLKDVYFTILGATTPGALKKALPKSAVSDGFLSRMLFIYQPPLEKWFEFPQSFISTDTLAERLAWIATHHHGEYTLSKEAAEEYSREYHEFMRHVQKVGTGDPEAISRARLTTYRLKVAMLIRCSRYEEGNEISLEDYRQARDIMESTTADVLSTVSTVERTEADDDVERVKSYIKQEGTVTRKVVLRKFSSKSLFCPSP